MAEILNTQRVCDGIDLRVKLDDNSIVTWHLHAKDLTQEQIEDRVRRIEINYELSRLQG